jgi:hypothetical protein
MELYQQRIKETADAIATFRTEHEKLFLGTDSHAKIRNSSNSTSPYSHVSGAQCNAMIERLLNVDSIVMPYSDEQHAHQKLWPQALVANRSSGYGEVGLVESHGSLWRLVPFMEGDTTRILLQCAV